MPEVDKISNLILEERDILYILKLEYEYYDNMQNDSEHYDFELRELFNLICHHCYLYLIETTRLEQLVSFSKIKFI